MFLKKKTTVQFLFFPSESVIYLTTIIFNWYGWKFVEVTYTFMTLCEKV